MAETRGISTGSSFGLQPSWSEVPEGMRGGLGAAKCGTGVQPPHPALREEPHGDSRRPAWKSCSRGHLLHRRHLKMCILWPHCHKGKYDPGWVRDYIFIIILFSPLSLVVKEIKAGTFSWALGTACWSWPGWGCCLTPRGGTGEEGSAWGWGSSRKPEPPEGGEDWGAQTLSFRSRSHYIKGQ